MATAVKKALTHVNKLKADLGKLATRLAIKNKAKKKKAAPGRK